MHGKKVFGIVLALLLVLAMAFALAACNNDSTDQTGGGTPGGETPGGETPGGETPGGDPQKPETPEEAWEFEELATGMWAIAGYKGSRDAAEIPAEFNGTAVVTIREGAFDGTDGLLSVTLPASLQRIESGAFDGSTLTSVTYGGTLAEWYDEVWCESGWRDGSVFEKVVCSDGGEFVIALADYSRGLSFALEEDEDGKYYDVTQYYLPDGDTTDTLRIPAVYKGLPVKTMANLTINDDETKSAIRKIEIADGNLIGIGDRTFTNWSTLEEVVLPEGLQYIGETAFYGTALKSIVIPDSVTSLGKQAFAACASLTSVDLGAGVTVLPERAFAQCTSLAAVDLSNVTSIGNYAFDACALIVDVDLANVMTLGSGAFRGCTSLVEIELVKVTEIGSYAFNGCTSLKKLYLGKPQNIKMGALQNCSSLTEIHFAGTTAEWAAVKKGTKWNGSAVTEVQCSDGDVEI